MKKDDTSQKKDKQKRIEQQSEGNNTLAKRDQALIGFWRESAKSLAELDSGMDSRPDADRERDRKALQVFERLVAHMDKTAMSSKEMEQ